MCQKCYRKLWDLKDTKSQSTQWKNPSPPSPKTRKASSSVTCMLVIFFFNIHITMTNKVFHTYKLWNRTAKDILWHLCEDVWQTLPEKWCTGDWLLHHDNAPAQLALSVPEFSSIMAILLSCTCHTPPHIHHPMTLFLLLEHNWHWREGHFMTSGKFMNNCRLHFKNCRGCSKLKGH